MKKLAFILIAFLTLAIGNKAKAIEDPFPVGTFIGSAHVGLLPGIGVNITGDYVLVDWWWKGHFTVGGYAGYNHIGIFSKSDQKYSNFAILPRATYGLNITDDFEVHAGVLAGIGYRGYTYSDSNGQLHRDHQLIPDIGGVAGVRYRLQGNFYVAGELNYTATMSYFNVGVSFVF